MSTLPTDRYDVAIVGGGMVGATLALALADTRLRVILIEAVAVDDAAQPSFDDRTTALGNGARSVLHRLGVWEAIESRAAPIRQIHVSDAGHFGFARLRAEEHELSAFGYTVGNRHIGSALWRALQSRQRIELCCPARVAQVMLQSQMAQLRVLDAAKQERLIEARLVVAADGANSLVKQAAGIASQSSPYQQVAVVANVRSERPAQAVAYERFTPTGPLALLPLHDGAYSVVWTLAAETAQAMKECSEAQYRRELQRSFGWRVGHFVQVGQRGSYPLALVQAQSIVGERVALIGNAAQALHPIAAQGFNLGLRDAAALAELIADADDPGARELLAGFASRRQQDRAGMIAFTDRLVKLFCDQRGSVVAVRNLGLLLFDLSPTAKQAMSRLSWGFGDTRPGSLSRALPLQS
jgi:2-octaprenyl-6-methoxyphenol hydroxylase